MAKILLTGMTSAHVSETSNNKNKTFMGVLADVLKLEGHEVIWQKSSVSETSDFYSQFDSVVVGLSPFGSLAANYAYGALNVIDRLWDSSKLVLLVDAPNASQIEPNLKLIAANPKSFVKPFFSARIGYSELVSSPEDVNRLLGVVDKLLKEGWPKTIFPLLPWKLSTDIKLPPNAKQKLIGVNLDSYLISTETILANDDRADKWAIDTPNSKWGTSIVQMLALPVVSMKVSRSSRDEEIFEQIKRSSGALISPDAREGTWWSYRLVQCLNANIPVVTDWQESHFLGEPWGILAASVESLGPQQRQLLALAQKEIYTANINSRAIAKHILEEILEIGRK